MNIRKLSKLASMPGNIKSLLGNEEGSLMPLIASSVMMLVGVAGLTIDGSRMFLVKDVLQKSLDSAGLAAGHTIDVDDMTADAQQFFNANIAAVENIVSDSGMSININDDKTLITLTATAKVKASFTSFFGYDEMTVSASTEITRETRGMELVLVIDNTGSMRTHGKMNAAKDAAAQLVELVYGDEDTSNNLWVGVVPYISHVNVGNSHEDWLTTEGLEKIDNGEYLPTEWKGCLFARSGEEDRTDTPPTEEPFSPWYWRSEPSTHLSRRENTWIDRYGNRTINEVNSNRAKGPNRGCGQPILPLVASKAKVLDTIDDMESWMFGGTATPVGLVWGWRVLSARWQGLWGGDTPDTLPLANNTPSMDKILIVLTDGVNSMLFTDRVRPSYLGGSDYTAYGTLADWGYRNIWSARRELDARFAEVCNNIKDDGIIIYGITFGRAPDRKTRNDFRTCASKPAYYFHAPSNSELQGVFDAIGRQLSNLRLSK